MAQEDVIRTTRNIECLDRLHSEVTKPLSNPKQRSIGSILYVDPIGVSSNGYTVDWAVIQLDNEAFDWANFKGNIVYIDTFLISPHPAVPVRG